MIGVLVALASNASAQEVPAPTALAPAATTLDTVEVLGSRRPLADFPGSVTVVRGETLADGQRQVSLSESLARVPGISVLDRQNYAQDLQIQSRGFGARSTFGIRGIKMVVDGIPSSAADGQGQAANFPLGSLDRIEVLRGPLALQYGNAAGGAIVAYTDLDGAPGAALDGWMGGDGSYRIAARADGGSAGEDWRWRVQGSEFATDGEREHSAARRSQFAAVAQWLPRDGERVRLVLNALTQPGTQDPLGLTRESWQRNPRGTDAAALEFNTRKSIENHQIGARWDRDYAPGRTAWLGGYRIQRDVEQFLAIPPSAQAAPGSAGGVIDLGRRSGGIEAGHRWSGARGAVAVGVELARLDEARRGFENFAGGALGVRGRLRRDEDNRVDGRDVYVTGDVEPASGWTVLAALRHSQLKVSSADHYITAGAGNSNGDDSGRLAYRESTASLGVAREVEHGEIFASVGRGFETPTITELAYRPDGGAGFNTALGPARFVSAEVGARWRASAGNASIAAYHVSGDHEIVPAESRGGRASYTNAGRTRRNGIEVGFAGPVGERWSYALAANAIRARFDQQFSYRVTRGPQTELQVVEAGNRIPGIPRADGFAELAWRSADDRLSAAVEARVSASMATDDRNSDATPGNARFAVRMRWQPVAAGGWHGFARVDNLFDRDYVGSVIVNDANGRYFEPGAGRSVTLGIGWNRQR